MIYLGSDWTVFLLNYLTNLCICFTKHHANFWQLPRECLIYVQPKGAGMTGVSRTTEYPLLYEILHTVSKS